MSTISRFRYLICLSHMRFMRKFREIKNAIKWQYQRIFCGMSDLQWWNLDHTITDTILQGLDKLTHGGKGTTGWPSQDGITYSQYNKELEQMKSGFEACKRLLDDYWYIKFYEEKTISKELMQKKIDEDYASFEHACDLLKKHYFSLWD